eukprot:g16205.t1
MPEIDNRMGFPEDWFSDKTDNLICSICQGVYRSPMQTANPTAADEDPCGYTFCAPCIKRWLSEKKSCPTCRRPLTVNQLHKDVPLQRRIADLMVVCQFDSTACKATGKCGKTGAFWDAHSKTCCLRKEKCLGCEECLTSAALANHLTKCQKVKARCTHGCGWVLEREKLQTHEADCEKKQASQLIPCKFAPVGCTQER